MKANKTLKLAMAVLAAAMVAGCDGKPETVTCAELDKVQDPAQRAELLKQCPPQKVESPPTNPSHGDGYRPSSGRSW